MRVNENFSSELILLQQTRRHRVQSSAAAAIKCAWIRILALCVRQRHSIRPEHYAFLISETDFDAILGRIRERGLDHWADPMRRRPGEINHNDGGTVRPGSVESGMSLTSSPLSSTIRASGYPTR